MQPVEELQFGQADLIIAVPRAWVDVDTLDNAPFAKGERRDTYFWNQIDSQEADEAGE